MEILKPGTLCVIVGGCPENIGLVVEVLEHIGAEPPRADAYLIRTTSGRNFPQLKFGRGEKRLAPGTSNEAVTDRHKLRPLVDAKDDETEEHDDVAILGPTHRGRISLCLSEKSNQVILRPQVITYLQASLTSPELVVTLV